jgi:hypothetical protein
VIAPRYRGRTAQTRRGAGPRPLDRNAFAGVIEARSSSAGRSGAWRPLALFDAFDLRVGYYKASDRLSISATLTEAVAAMLRTSLEPACGEKLRGTDSHATTTLRQDYRLAG